MKRKWFWALFLGAAASWPSAGIIEANGEHGHFGGLSGGAGEADANGAAKDAAADTENK